MPDHDNHRLSSLSALLPKLTLTLMLALLTGLLAGCGGGTDEAEVNREDSASSGPEQSRSVPQSTVRGSGNESTEEADGRPEETGAEKASIANEAGSVMVLEYHRVGGDPAFAPEWTISAQRFRRELTHLYENGYHPVNFRELVRGEMEVPAGKTPVVLTFDDSSDTQFTLVRQGGEWAPDPGSAVGVLADFHRDHPDWPMKGTFFVLPEANAPNDFFGQPELTGEKLRYLDQSGFEIGSHTLYHANLALASPEGVREQLARSVEEIQNHLPDYEVDTLSLPFGEYPPNEELLKSGSWQELEYEIEGAAEVSGGASAAPHDTRFDPYHVPRIQTGDLAYQSQDLFGYFEQNPEERYVSDGDPAMVSFPEGAGANLNKEEIKAAGKRIRAY